MRTLSALAILASVAGMALVIGSTSSPASRAHACSKSTLREGIVPFLRAANRGDAGILKQTIANERRFRVFSQGFEYSRQSPERFFSTTDRRKLVRHLLRREEKGDLHRLRSISHNSYDRHFELCVLRFELDRRIGDGPIERFVGKGALDERSGRVSLWNIGGLAAPPETRRAGPAVTAECASTDVGPRWRRSAVHVGRFGVFFHGLGWADKVGHGNYALKAPAVLVGDQPVTLRVPAHALGDAGLFYDQEHPLNSTSRISKAPAEVTFEPCPDGPRSVWAGGLLLDTVREPLTLEVVVSDSRTERLRLEPGCRGGPGGRGGHSCSRSGQ